MPLKTKSTVQNYLSFLEKSLLVKIAAGLAGFLFLYVYLPIYLKHSLKYDSYLALIIFHLFNLAAILLVLKLAINKKYSFNYKIGFLQEETNVSANRNNQLLKEGVALQSKIIRYSSLKKVVEEINEDLRIDSVANNLVSIAFSLVSNNKGNCVLYLVDNQTQKLALFRSRKEDRKLVVKSKEGDMLDYWVLRHASPLLVEDIKKDFRFDTERFCEYPRQIASLVSSPLISDHRFLGILRLDHPEPNFFSLDDLRFLMTICDLGAVALENSQFFRETQNLAIHDELTSLYTKGFFMQSLKEECERALRSKKPFSFFMLDIDNFKGYNDRFGHTAGDIVLKNISQMILEALKDFSPIVSRFGGEEFCVILPGMHRDEAVTLAGQLRERVEKKKILLRRQETTVTVSIGVAAFPADAADKDSLIHKADKAMYQAKQKGRNRVCSI